MLDIFKKSLLAGLGASIVTREMVIEATKRLVKEGKLNTEEVQRLADDLMESGRQHWQSVEHEAREAVNKAVDSMGVARSEELEELQVRMGDLEQQVHILFKERSGTAFGKKNEAQ
jgi:polyhydroxyalkanoate synthesis regulator phasin